MATDWGPQCPTSLRLEEASHAWSHRAETTTVMGFGLPFCSSQRNQGSKNPNELWRGEGVKVQTTKPADLKFESWNSHGRSRLIPSCPQISTCFMGHGHAYTYNKWILKKKTTQAVFIKRKLSEVYSGMWDLPFYETLASQEKKQHLCHLLCKAGHLGLFPSQ